MSETKENPQSEEEAKMMAEWEAMAADDDNASEPEQPVDAAPENATDDSSEEVKTADDGRILDQTEIDSLLGFDDS
ncbi:MAG: hypothetical protein KAI76_02465, partial [Alphaproteobacteria bacterium]|nr:hypothetical protein [Alphaproteobacteria bacterium]